MAWVATVGLQLNARHFAASQPRAGADAAVQALRGLRSQAVYSGGYKRHP